MVELCLTMLQSLQDLHPCSLGILSAIYGKAQSKAILKQNTNYIPIKRHFMHATTKHYQAAHIALVKVKV